MSAPTCVRCANPGTPDWPLAWTGRGDLAHADPPDCVEWGDESCTHRGEAHAPENPCRTPAPGYARCGYCRRAHKLGALLHGERHCKLAVDEQDGTGRLPSVTIRPFGTDAPFFVRFPSLAASGLPDLVNIPPGTRGVILEEWDDDDTVVVCKACAERTPDEGWKAYKPGREAGDGDEAGGDPILGIPADGEWRSIEETAGLLGMGQRNGKPLVRQMARDGGLEVSEQPTGAGGSNRKMYRRPVPA